VNREIPVIADPILVNREFGTGCVKVTPAHDPKRLSNAACVTGWEMINILTPDGHINENGGPYAGMDRYAARRQRGRRSGGPGPDQRRSRTTNPNVGHSARRKTATIRAVSLGTSGSCAWAIWNRSTRARSKA